MNEDLSFTELSEPAIIVQVPITRSQNPGSASPESVAKDPIYVNITLVLTDNLVMDEVSENRSAGEGGGPETGACESAGVNPDDNRSRRAFLHGSARKLAYAAPLILLFHPKPACASGGSQLTQP